MTGQKVKQTKSFIPKTKTNVHSITGGQKQNIDTGASGGAFSDFHYLHGAMGNRALNGMIQPKLTMGAAKNKFESEADTVAKQVVRNMLSSKKEVKTGQGIKVSGVANQSGGRINKNLENEIRRAKAGGASMSNTVLKPMENAFDANFTGVKLHKGARADKLNRMFNARAFTMGNNIFFRRGEYNPASPGGKTLIAHELAHVVQQTGAGVSGHSTVSAGNAGAPVLQRKITYNYAEKKGVLQNIGIGKRIQQLLDKSDAKMAEKVDELFIAKGIPPVPDAVEGYNFDADTLDVPLVGFSEKLNGIVKKLKDEANATFAKNGLKKGFFGVKAE